MKTTVTPEDIKKIMDSATISSQRIDQKTCLVRCELETGFVLYETSSCIDPNNYDEEIGKRICLQKIEDKLWELEGYKVSYENKIEKQIEHYKAFI